MKFNVTKASPFIRDLVLQALTRICVDARQRALPEGTDNLLAVVLADAPHPNAEGGKDSELTLLLNGHEIDIGAWADAVERGLEMAIARGVEDKIRGDLANRLEGVDTALAALREQLIENAAEAMHKPSSHKLNCTDGGLNNTLAVPCPCECGGTLRSDGRNKQETLTFLLCPTCGCTHHADDAERTP